MKAFGVTSTKRAGRCRICRRSRNRCPVTNWCPGSRSWHSQSAERRSREAHRYAAKVLASAEVKTKLHAGGFDIDSTDAATRLPV